MIGVHTPFRPSSLRTQVFCRGQSLSEQHWLSGQPQTPLVQMFRVAPLIGTIHSLLT
jgi:hypothetical protein